MLSDETDGRGTTAEKFDIFLLALESNIRKKQATICSNVENKLEFLYFFFFLFMKKIRYLRSTFDMLLGRLIVVGRFVN